MNQDANKIWVGQFYSKSWLEKNDIEMYSTHSDEKSVIAGGFLRTLKNKIYKYM